MQGCILGSGQCNRVCNCASTRGWDRGAAFGAAAGARNILNGWRRYPLHTRDNPLHLVPVTLLTHHSTRYIPVTTRYTLLHHIVIPGPGDTVQIDVGTCIVCNHTCAGNAPPSGLNVGLNVGIWVNLAALHLECPNVLQSPARRTSVKRRAASLQCTCMSSVLICTIVASASSCRLCAAIVQLA